MCVHVCVCFNIENLKHSDKCILQTILGEESEVILLTISQLSKIISHIKGENTNLY